MRLLVAPHELSISGSPTIAVDLAAGAAAAGHEVAVYGIPGPLVDRIEDLGLEFIAARPLRYRPGPSRIAQLASLARSRRLDLIHAYEWPPCLDAYFGAHLLRGVPVVCTVMGMSVPTLVPTSVPLIMGTEALGEAAGATHDAPIWALEPPIDADADHPGIDGTQFRREHGVAGESLLAVTVSRLAVDFKLDALVRCIDAIDELAGTLPVQLLVVGGGDAEDVLRVRGAAVNLRRGREVVRFTGPLSDPRAAYAAADVVLGMGSSALRAMSIGRPVIVQGESGFSEIVEPGTAPYFLRHGFWGHGGDEPTPQRLTEQLHRLMSDRARRDELGAFGRSMVEERFSLRRSIERQLRIYDEVLARPQRRRVKDAVVAAERSLLLELHNHDPRRKRIRRQDEERLLGAARRLQVDVEDPLPRIPHPA